MTIEKDKTNDDNKVKLGSDWDIIHFILRYERGISIRDIAKGVVIKGTPNTKAITNNTDLEAFIFNRIERLIKEGKLTKGIDNKYVISPDLIKRFTEPVILKQYATLDYLVTAIIEYTKKTLDSQLEGIEDPDAMIKYVRDKIEDMVDTIADHNEG